jgi:hypothetical protein
MSTPNGAQLTCDPRVFFFNYITCYAPSSCQRIFFFFARECTCLQDVVQAPLVQPDLAGGGAPAVHDGEGPDI